MQSNVENIFKIILMIFDFRDKLWNTMINTYPTRENCGIIDHNGCEKYLPVQHISIVPRLLGDQS